METNEINEETKVEEAKMEKPVMEERKTETKKKLTISTKQIFIFSVIAVAIIIIIAVGAKISKNKKMEQKVENMYNTMEETSNVINQIADTIYNEWYDYVYKDDYNTVDEALWMAFILEADNVGKAKDNDEKIDNLFQEIKESNYKNKNEDGYYAMVDAYDSYNEYYEFVINVSGSFNSYSAKKETLKKEFKSYLSKFERSL